MAKLELQSEPIFTKFGMLDVVGAFLMTLAAKFCSGLAQLSKMMRSFFATGHQ